MIHVNENFRYVIRDEASIEDFEDGSLMLLCRQKKIVEINPSARRVLSLMDGKRNLRQVIKKFARNHRMQEKKVREDIQKLVIDLGAQGAIRPSVKVTL
jgi:Mg2+ and Co2+ transporter CorA